MTRTCLLIAAAVAMSACAESSTDLGSGAMGSDSFQDDDPPMGAGDTDADDDDDDDDGGADSESGEAPRSPVGGPCDNTAQCVTEAVCAATFEDGEAGPLVCHDACIEADDESAWCSDDAACCSGICGSRGLCEAAESTE